MHCVGLSLPLATPTPLLASKGYPYNTLKTLFFTEYRDSDCNWGDLKRQRLIWYIFHTLLI